MLIFFQISYEIYVTISFINKEEEIERMILCTFLIKRIVAYTEEYEF